ncbi:hypothetical protein HYT55_00545 [Candidatus Woesearchaeota archaeon]|nr:hypothetical protein [Candidatus Woesearchaeota archaeon]
MVTYEESTAGWLDHYFGNNVGFMRNYHCSKEVREIFSERERGKILNHSQ